MLDLQSTIREALQNAPSEHLGLGLAALIEARFTVWPKEESALREPLAGHRFRSFAGLSGRKSNLMKYVVLVGASKFEPPTSCARTRHSKRVPAARSGSSVRITHKQEVGLLRVSDRDAPMMRCDP